MLRRILWLLMGLILSHTGIANDPFDKARRQAIPQTSVEKQDRAPSQACHPTHSTIFPQTAFAQIQVIGVLQHKTDWQLMLFSENQVSLAKAGDVIAAKHIQIEKIGKQHIDFLRWNNDPHCKATTPFQLKF